MPHPTLSVSFLPSIACRLAASLLLASIGWNAGAEIIPLPADGSDLVGEIRWATARQEDTLIDIAHALSVGQDEIVMANPTVDRWLPKAGTRVLIPRRFLLPDAPRAGIVVNVPEMRLYYYPAKFTTKKVTVVPKAKVKGKTAATKQEVLTVASPATEVITYPVSIGRMDWRTPLGATRVVQKVKDPVWIPPETIKREHAADGDILPDVVPAGPNNPLGAFAMKLGVAGYLIHGTGVDKADGIGMRVTHGCIRMYPEDIARLFPIVNVNTPVHLVNQPIKLGWQGGALYMEVQQPLDEDRMEYGQLLSMAMDLIRRKIADRPVMLDGGAIQAALRQPSGIPVAISRTGAPGVQQALPQSEPAYPPPQAAEPPVAEELTPEMQSPPPIAYPGDPEPQVQPVQGEPAYEGYSVQEPAGQGYTSGETTGQEDYGYGQSAPKITNQPAPLDYPDPYGEEENEAAPQQQEAPVAEPPG